MRLWLFFVLPPVYDCKGEKKHEKENRECTACGKQPAADAAQPVADPTQAYLDTVDVDYAYELALKLEDIRSNETLGYRTAGSDAELATGDMLKAEMERIGLQNVTKDAFTLDT